MNFFTEALSKRNSVHKQSHLQVHCEHQRYLLPTLLYLDIHKALTLTPQQRVQPGGQLQGPRCHPRRLVAPHSGLCAARGCPAKLHACRGGARGSSPLGFLGLAPPALPLSYPSASTARHRGPRTVFEKPRERPVGWDGCIRPWSLTVALGSVRHAEEQGGVTAELRGKGGQNRRSGTGVRGLSQPAGRGSRARGTGEGKGGLAPAASGADGGGGIAASGSGRGGVREGWLSRRAEAGPQVSSSAESLTRGPTRSRAPGRGRETWFTLMSGETCTGGTILPVTFAPEAQRGPRRTPQGPGKHWRRRRPPRWAHAPSAARRRRSRPLAAGGSTARAPVRGGVTSPGARLATGSACAVAQAARAGSPERVRPLQALKFSDQVEHKSRPAHHRYKYLKSISPHYKVRNSVLAILPPWAAVRPQPRRGSSRPAAAPGQPRGQPRKGLEALGRESGVRVQNVT